MTNGSYQTYEEAAAAYRAQCAMLLDVPVLGGGASTTRGAADVLDEQFIDKVDLLADTSAQMVMLGRGYRESDDMVARAGITAHFLAQATAEAQLAAELLEMAANEQAGQPPQATTRATQMATLRDATAAVERTLATPVTAGIPVTLGATRAATATTVEAAISELHQTADQATLTIIQQVIELGGDLAYNLVIGTSWKDVRSAAGWFRKDIAVQLDKIQEGASRMVGRAAAVAQKTLLNVYDKILVLLGTDVESKARKQIQTWLDQLADQQQVDMFDQLVSTLYQVEPFRQALDGWLDTTNAELAVLNGTTDAVTDVQNQFITYTGYARQLAGALSILRKFVKGYPPILPITVSFQVALLATMVYAGWDFVGYRQVGFLNVTDGVAEIIQQRLGVSSD